MMIVNDEFYFVVRNRRNEGWFETFFTLRYVEKKEHHKWETTLLVP